MDEDEATEIRQGFLNLRNDWLRRRIFNAASTYLVLEAIQQRGEDRDMALAAHDHRMVEYHVEKNDAKRAKQYVLIHSQLRMQIYINGVRSSLVKYQKR